MESIKTKPFRLSVSESAQAYELSRRKLPRSVRNTNNIVLVLTFVFVLSPLAIAIPAAIFLPNVRQQLLDFVFFILKGLGIVLIFFYLILPLLLRFRIWISRLTNPKLYNQDVVISFSNQGVDFLQANANSHTDWSYYQSYYENKAFFLLTYGRAISYAVPKRSLETEQIDAIRELIKSHIGKLSTD